MAGAIGDAKASRNGPKGRKASVLKGMRRRRMAGAIGDAKASRNGPKGRKASAKNS